ncbi:sugar phosphate isomerase/epimerase family protein [Alkalihalobacillus trypoxylicola]|uniref:Sugar phosphate isomerase n=1 Tax=Alkalihalobacillus trypoxylicola TaxID=519424 RepID=A0A161PJ75_9BACI|nr:sugar phosphate isomerase/epimerase [Alkalihalobacillus trypoxylicola]KYG29331.1 sugar phosphate isomerase [Alkalihalobacillus trypoxylicola]
MSVGVLAHLFGQKPYKELAEDVASKGFNHIQLALWKAVADYDFTKPGKLNPGLAKDMAKQFAKNNVSVSVFACYLHFFEKDKDLHKENLERFKELIRYARYFGHPVVAAEVGKSEDGKFHQDDWDRLKSALEELAEEAKKWGTGIAIEPAHGHLIGTARELKLMLDKIDASNIGVVLDPGNLMTEENFHRQDEVIEEAFELLGDKIVACHAKDRYFDQDGKLAVTPAGLGEMNYELYLKLLHQYKPHCEIIMEEASPERMLASKEYIEKIREKVML